MKWNWGTGIIITFIAFISFILYFVFTMMTDKRLDFDMVDENYYQQELQVQKDIDKQNNANSENVNLVYSEQKDSVCFTFPKNLDLSKIKGKAIFYRPSNKILDFEMPLELKTNQLVVPKTKLVSGRWNVSIDWQYEEKAYMEKFNLNL